MQALRTGSPLSTHGAAEHGLTLNTHSSSWGGQGMGVWAGGCGLGWRAKSQEEAAVELPGAAWEEQGNPRGSARGGVWKVEAGWDRRSCRACGGCAAGVRRQDSRQGRGCPHRGAIHRPWDRKPAGSSARWCARALSEGSGARPGPGGEWWGCWRGEEEKQPHRDRGCVWKRRGALVFLPVYSRMFGLAALLCLMFLFPPANSLFPPSESKHDILRPSQVRCLLQMRVGNRGLSPL